MALDLVRLQWRYRRRQW